MIEEKKCPQHYLININGKYDIEVNDLIRGIYKSINIDNLKKINHIKWSYYQNAIEYLLRAFRKDDLEKDIKKTIHELELFLKEDFE
jgi:hypothetical protein